jgi:hypothetical protein
MFLVLFFSCKCDTELTRVCVGGVVTPTSGRANVLNSGFLSTICFTDESTFTLNNEPNVQNTRYWAQENPRVNRTPQKHLK